MYAFCLDFEDLEAVEDTLLIAHLVVRERVYLPADKASHPAQEILLK